MDFRIQLDKLLGNILKGRDVFVNFEGAISLTRDWSKRFPCRYDLVIGIPRTGLMIAGMIADQFAIPLSTPDILPAFWKPPTMPMRELKHILIVEDSTTRTTHLRSAKLEVLGLFPGARVDLGSLFVSDSVNPVDTYGFKLNGHCIFEWELMNIEFAGKIASDLDGVLCADPSPELMKDEVQFEEWMRNAPPYRIPVYGLSAIITSRAEKHREATEEWLSKNGVKYCRLCMDLSKEGEYRDFISYKIDAINRIKPQLFLESNDETARHIHYQTGVTVISMETMSMYSD